MKTGSILVVDLSAYMAAETKTTKAPRKKRHVPSVLWELTDIGRAEMLARKDSHGRPFFTIEILDEDYVFSPPPSTVEDRAYARSGLLAELRQVPVTEACSRCGCALSAERAIQICADCKK